MRFKSLVLLSTLLPLSLLADDLAAERPGFSVPSAPVGLGVLQWEQGYSFEWAQLGSLKLRTFSAPQSTLRFGITQALEFRFSAAGYSSQSLRNGSGKTSLSGLNDYAIGAKLRLLKQNETRPEISVIGNLSLPAKGSPFTSNGHDPSFTLAADKDLPHKLSVIANANFSSVTTGLSSRNYSSGESVWIARTMRPMSPFVEVFHTTLGSGLGSEVVADAGLSRNIGKNAQIDFEAGHTLAGDRPSFYASVGLVVRAPQALLGPERFHFRQH